MTLRLNAAEYAHLCRQAEVTGLKKEPLVRQLIMGVNLRPRPPDAYADLLRALSAIGNNINQLAHQANARGAATGDHGSAASGAAGHTIGAGAVLNGVYEDHCHS